MALIRCANALKVANNNTSNFIGRYGSDKFIIVAELDDEEDALRLCENVRQALIKECEKDGILYDLSFSFGFVQFKPEMKTIQNFVSAADEKFKEIYDSDEFCRIVADYIKKNKEIIKIPSWKKSDWVFLTNPGIRSGVFLRRFFQCAKHKTG